MVETIKRNDLVGSNHVDEFQELSQWVENAFESGFKKTLGSLENNLASAVEGIIDSVNSELAESLRSHNTASDGSELSDSRANENIEENASILTR